jgi:hypothetical protein
MISLGLNKRFLVSLSSSSVDGGGSGNDLAVGAILEHLEWDVGQLLSSLEELELEL